MSIICASTAQQYRPLRLLFFCKVKSLDNLEGMTTQIHTRINMESLNNVNIYIFFEVTTLILFISIYIIKKQNTGVTLLEHRPDVFGSGLVVQVFCGESEEKQTVSG